MQLQELNSLFLLEPTWTVSIDGRDFAQFSSTEIEFIGENIRIGRKLRKVLRADWLRSNVARLHTRDRTNSRPEVLTFFPGNQLPCGTVLRRRRRSFQTLLGQALVSHFRIRTPIREILYSDKQRGIGGAYPRFIFGNRAVIAVD